MCVPASELRIVVAVYTATAAAASVLPPQMQQEKAETSPRAHHWSTLSGVKRWCQKL
jgi:hypothetical protein